MRNWDELTQFFTEMSQDTRPSRQYTVTHAKAMLELIQRIQGRSEFAQILTGTAHGSLFFALPDQKRTVHVLGEDAGKYLVKFVNEDLSSAKEITVEISQVIDTLLRYIRELGAQIIAK